MTSTPATEEMMTSFKSAPNAGQALALYERMLLIRRMEERLRADNAAGKLPGAVHLYIGQEAIAAAVMAEIWAKRTGICKGMGGSMHVADFSKGILGANGIVGGGFAIATGAAFAAKLDKSGRLAVAFFGDGASNQGVFMECLNVSSLWKLPLIFVCEHNQFSEFTPAADVTSGEIADRARAFKIPASVIDGNDVAAVWQAAGEAVERARRG